MVVVRVICRSKGSGSPFDRTDQEQSRSPVARDIRGMTTTAGTAEAAPMQVRPNTMAGSPVDSGLYGATEPNVRVSYRPGCLNLTAGGRSAWLTLTRRLVKVLLSCDVLWLCRSLRESVRSPATVR